MRARPNRGASWLVALGPVAVVALQVARGAPPRVTLLFGVAMGAVLFVAS